MAEESPQSYQEEIRDYLLGRLGKLRTTAAARVHETPLQTSRILNWWIFEGKRYQGMSRPLAQEWESVARQIRRLLACYSPRWRPLANPEGEVDWLSTAYHSLVSGRQEYICRTTQLGLGDDEAAALIGWRAWISERWKGYLEALGAPEGAPEKLPWAAETRTEFEERQLRRWAFIARRSRWPLLRNVVAESLRAAFEPQLVNQLPLPTDPATLFELVCLVRVLRGFEPDPREIRWLGKEENGNEIRVPGITCHFQYSIPREEMLATPVFDGGLREAMVRSDVRVPSRMDGLILFDEPRGGFDGIILEAKSGRQGPDAAIWQLKCYSTWCATQDVRKLLKAGVVEATAKVGVGARGWNGEPWVFLEAGELARFATGLPRPAKVVAHAASEQLRLVSSTPDISGSSRISRK